MFPVTANFECSFDINKDEKPESFGYEFETKGNFSFTYRGAVLLFY